MLDFTVVVAGSSACGKTTLIRSFLQKESRLSQPPEPTVHEVHTVYAKRDRKKVRLVMVDTRDCEANDQSTRSAYAAADLVILCYSVRDVFYFDELQSKWMVTIRRFNTKVPVLLVATQRDLRDDRTVLRELSHIKCRPVTYYDGYLLAQRLRVANFMECSALDRDSVNKVFDAVLDICLRKDQKESKTSTCSFL